MIHFYFQLPNVADWLALAFTFIGLCIAVYALIHWRKQKEWDLLVECISFAPVALEFIELKYSPQLDDLIFNEKAYELAKGASQKKLINMNINRQKRLNRAEEQITLLKSKLDFVFKKDNIVRKFYSDLKIKLDNYYISEHEIIIFGWADEKHRETPSYESNKTIDNVRKRLREAYNRIHQIPEKELAELKENLEEIKRYEIRSF